MSDDGEPKGTAGKPILEILKGTRCTNLLVAVVRFFGGVKLGTGGLVRAYGDAARAVLAELPLSPLVERDSYRIELTYEQLDPVLRILKSYDAEPEETSYGISVVLTGTIESTAREECSFRISEATNGAVELRV